MLPLLNHFCFGYVLTDSVLYHAHSCVKYSFDISSFYKNIISLPYSIIFLYFFALFIEGGFISPCNSLEPCIQLGISFPFSLAFCFSSFLSYVKLPQTTTLPSCISFSFGWILSVAPIQCYESLATVLQILCLPDLTP